MTAPGQSSAEGGAPELLLESGSEPTTPSAERLCDAYLADDTCCQRVAISAYDFAAQGIDHDLLWRACSSDHQRRVAQQLLDAGNWTIPIEVYNDLQWSLVDEGGAAELLGDDLDQGEDADNERPHDRVLVKTNRQALRRVLDGQMGETVADAAVEGSPERVGALLEDAELGVVHGASSSSVGEISEGTAGQMPARGGEATAGGPGGTRPAGSSGLPDASPLDFTAGPGLGLEDLDLFAPERFVWLSDGVAVMPSEIAAMAVEGRTNASTAVYLKGAGTRSWISVPRPLSEVVDVLEAARTGGSSPPS